MSTFALSNSIKVRLFKKFSAQLNNNAHVHSPIKPAINSKYICRMLSSGVEELPVVGRGLGGKHWRETEARLEPREERFEGARSVDGDSRAK